MGAGGEEDKYTVKRNGVGVFGGEAIGESVENCSESSNGGRSSHIANCIEWLKSLPVFVFVLGLRVSYLGSVMNLENLPLFLTGSQMVHSKNVQFSN